MRARHLSLVLSTALLAAACGDDDPAPTVEILEVTPESLDPTDDAADDLSILLYYTDSDGDLGGGTADVHDCRADGLVTSLDIPALANEDAAEQGVPIEGMLDLVITDIGDVALDAEPPAACSDLGIDAMSDGEAVFCVVLTDAAGNAGLGDCTGAIAFGAPE